MDPMALLDMERRTGFSHNDVDDFATRMDLISEAMEQIKDGTFDPNNCKIPGYKSPEQEEKEAQEKIHREQERKRKEQERLAQEKQEEQELWWRRAKLRFAIDEDEDDDPNEGQSQDNKATKWANRVLAAYKARDANDYSTWQSWVPQDPVTLEEQAAREAALEKVRNEEFEKTNPAFCDQFKEDLEKRQQSQRDRERDAEKLKLLGNRYYKRKEYAMAITQYMKALDKSPYSVAVLTNISQCFLRLELLDDSVEFSTRALYVCPTHVKALSRRAAVWHQKKKWEQAAQDMDKALRLDPENPDVVEQHSIVVGDYEDSLAESQLKQQMGKKDSQGYEELHLVQELLDKMDQHEQQDDLHEANDDARGSIVHEAWMAYEVLVPIIERNGSAKDLLRTSGAFHKLTQRLVLVLHALPTGLLARWANTEEHEDNDAKMKITIQMEQRTVEAMLHTMAVCLANSPRNQVVLYRDIGFRDAIIDTLSSGTISVVATPLRQKLYQLVEEAIESKSWKRLLLASSDVLQALLASMTTPLDPAGSSRTQESEAYTQAAVSISSILLTISSDESSGGLKLLTADTACLQTIATALPIHLRSPATLSNLLGVLTNLSTSQTLRKSLDLESSPSESISIASTRASLVRSLLVLASHFTKSSLSDQKRQVFQRCAERSLAALLNFTHDADSRVRGELLAKDKALKVVHSILGFVTDQNLEPLLLILSRTVSLLCRLHTSTTTTTTTAHDQLTEPLLLDHLCRICQLSLPMFSAASTAAASQDLWQTHAQIWCHVGWCITVNAASVGAYLSEKHAVPAMVETLQLVNAQRLYRRSSGDPPGGPERIVGNIVKVLIAMVPLDQKQTTSGGFWTRKAHLQVLVDALQALPDGLARKNVAILLAKLCQVGGVAVKDKVRELRGLEMMISMSKSLQTTTTTTKTTGATPATAKAVAF